MNYEQAKLAQPHAAEVLKVLEGLEWNCKVCNVIEMGTHLASSRGITSGCFHCRGKGKISYTWTPQVGDNVLIKNSVSILVETDYMEDYPYRTSTEETFNKWDIEEHSVTPILDWQIVEEVLEKAGYWLDISKPLEIYLEMGYMKVCCKIKKASDDKCIVSGNANSRLIAVYKAIEGLGKVMKKC